MNNEKTEYHILSLGAGVQSTAVYLLGMEGKIPLTHAVFADTGDEPKAIYEHLEWMKSLGGPPIHVASKGHKLSDAILHQKHGRFAAVPFFTKKLDGEISMTRRQCSKEYKVEVIERYIRREILGLQPRRRIPKNVTVQEYFGISLDEGHRSLGVRKRCKHPNFPLIDMLWTRGSCYEYLRDKVPHQTPRSACVFCPYHDDREWIHVRNSPEDWALAVKVDEVLRKPGHIVNRKMKLPMYAHRSGVPLKDAQFKNEQQFNAFTRECEGMCGV